MVRLVWNEPDDRVYEYGTDRGVFYPQRLSGVAWPGLIGVEESYDGELTIGYLDGVAFGQFETSSSFAATIRAVSRPSEFDRAEGVKRAAPFLVITQQPKASFGMSYRTLVSDGLGTLHYKVHLLYNVTIDPSSRTFTTQGETDEITPLELSVRCIPDPVPERQAIAHLEINSSEPNLSVLEAALYGTESTSPKLPSAAEVYQILGW